MSGTVNSSNPEEYLEALQARMDEIRREEQAEWQAFQDNPSIGAPQVNDARDVERSEILRVMDQQRHIIAEREDAKKKKKGKRGSKGNRKPEAKDHSDRKDDDDMGGGSAGGLLQTVK